MADITVVTGPMGSGKSERVIAEIKKYQIAQRRVLVVKPIEDTRTPGAIASRKLIDGKWVLVEAIPAFDVRDEEHLGDLIRRHNPNVVIADEGQLFGKWFLRVVIHAAKYLDIPFWISALDLDAWLQPFLLAPDLCAIADRVIKETAVCSKCHSFGARFTQKIGGESSKRIELGSTGLYEARCARCHTMPMEEASS